MAKIKWIKTGHAVSGEGTTIEYSVKNTNVTIESRKRHIPHAGGRTGFWDHTTYFVLKDGQDVMEKYSLRDAKEYAENMIEEANNND